MGVCASASLHRARRTAYEAVSTPRSPSSPTRPSKSHRKQATPGLARAQATQATCQPPSASLHPTTSHYKLAPESRGRRTGLGAPTSRFRAYALRAIARARSCRATCDRAWAHAMTAGPRAPHDTQPKAQGALRARSGPTLAEGERGVAPPGWSRDGLERGAAIWVDGGRVACRARMLEWEEREMATGRMAGRVASCGGVLCENSEGLQRRPPARRRSCPPSSARGTYRSNKLQSFILACTTISVSGCSPGWACSSRGNEATLVQGCVEQALRRWHGVMAWLVTAGLEPCLWYDWRNPQQRMAKSPPTAVRQTQRHRQGNIQAGPIVVRPTLQPRRDPPCAILPARALPPPNSTPGRPLRVPTPAT